MFNIFKSKRRQELRDAPFPESWRRIIRARFPLYDRLPVTDRRELEGHLQVLVAEKNFEGAGGLVMTEEIRLTIAAQASLLLLHRATDYYPGLQSIVVYPHAYFAHRAHHTDYGVVREGDETLLGESWTQGTIVLSWDDVRGGAANPFDGHNVVLHEFSHQLDTEDGIADGAPPLAADKPFWKRTGVYAAWALVLSSEYNNLRELVEKGRKGDIDRYGATDPAEFFAVITECFFEKPAQLQKKHPALYDELREFYRQDPAAWTTPDTI